MIWSFFLVLAELVNFQPTGKCLYSQKFGQLDDDTPLITKFIEAIPSFEDYDSGTQLIGKIQFIYSGYDDLLFVVCADKTDDVIPIVQSIENMKIGFAQKFFPLIKEGKDDPSLFRPFREDIEAALSTLLRSEKPAIAPAETVKPAVKPAIVEKPKPVPIPPKEMIKIGFIGNKNVGKRTLLNLLFSGPSGKGQKPEDTEMVMKKGPISEKYNALLITLPNQMIESGKTQFLSNTDIVILVNESVFKDVMATRKLLDPIKTILPKAKYGVIANKQDASGAVDVEAIRKVYDLPTIGMVATKSSEYEKLKSFVIELIEGI